MIELILGLLGKAISFLDKKEQNKFFNHYLKLKDNWKKLDERKWKEINKPRPDDAILDNLNRDLGGLEAEIKDFGNKVLAKIEVKNE